MWLVEHLPEWRKPHAGSGYQCRKKSAARGYTILSLKSLESPKRLKSAYMGSSASRPSRSLTVFRTRPNLLMSEARRSVSGEGKTFVQKFSPLPKLILSRRREARERKCSERRQRHGRKNGTRTACLLSQGDIRDRGKCIAYWRRRTSIPGHRR
jgi:hypothetical protein